MRTKINLNDGVVFRLNENSPAYQQLNNKLWEFSRPDGYYRMPLWYMIHYLGPHMVDGACVLEDNNFTLAV